jgi:hypothetical protein
MMNQNFPHHLHILPYNAFDCWWIAYAMIELAQPLQLQIIHSEYAHEAIFVVPLFQRDFLSASKD